MKRGILKLNAVLKGIILWFRPGAFLNFLTGPFLFLSNLLSLTKWISKIPKSNTTLNDFFTFKRDHSKRYKLYEHLLKTENLSQEKVDYLEFGVSQAHSFKWWIKENKNPESRFYGFDTFEGLPENWGTYDKGEMSAMIPTIDDSRSTFLKGLFQDTLVDFVKNHSFDSRKKIIHLDADLFSSTLFVLTTLARDLNKGDIILFDEFNVPNHEWMAFKVFTESFYVKMEFLGGVNNFYQVAFKII